MTRTRPSRDSSLRTAAVLIAGIAVLYLAREILIPLASAIMLSLILAAPVSWLQKLRLGRVPSVILVMMFAVAVAGGIGIVLFNQLVDVVNELPRYQLNIHNKIEAIRTPSKGALGRAADSVKTLAEELSGVQAPAATNPSTGGRRNAKNPPAGPMPVQVVEQPQSEIQYVEGLLKPVLAPLGVIGIVLIFTVFLLIQQNDLRNRLFRLAGMHRLNVMTQTLDDATQRISRYFLMQLLVNTCYGVLIATGLFFIGVPYAALWGTVAGMLRIVPYIGSLVGGLLPLILSMAVFDHWGRPLLVFLLFASLELVLSNFIEPWLYGVHTGISALALLLTTVFWATLWGPPGLILATPLTVCVVVLGRHLPQLSFLHILLGDEPGLTAEAHLYQRLLAMDDQESRAVAERYLSEHSLIELYDSVIIPALTMAEQDRHKGAIDPDREEFLFLSIKEMLSEFSEKSRRPRQLMTDMPGTTGRVMCIPASDEADAITAAMLAQLLELENYAAISFPPDLGVQHMVGFMQPSENDVFCISALPPFAFASAKSLTSQLRVRFPRTRIVVCVWGFNGDVDRALERFQPSPPDSLVATLAEAVRSVVEADPKTSAA